MKLQEIGESVPVRTDERSFIIRGQRELLVGGEFHYFRTPHELWEDRLIKMKRCGCNHVTTYIPWNWHEPEEGKERWTGDQDLAHFLRLCTKHGLFIVVKPGPYICAEWDFGGHPDWLLPKHLRLRMLDDKYLGYVEKWYRRVAEVIRPFMVTCGGNIIAIQVENEYDHLLWGDEHISVEDAKAYFRRLEGMMDKYGINIPKFANDASFLRGSNIIETRTYYPSIPWFWKWELEFYDNYVKQSKAAQPDKPVMVLELQAGWFAMFGHEPYVPDRLLTEAVTNSTLALGASYLNLYMFCGGTTFPFWGCRGDIIDVLPIGTGVTTSFDFGGSPIREWGELNPDRYDWMRIFCRFTQDFKDLILLSDNSEEMGILRGGEDVAVIQKHDVRPDRSLSEPSERIRLISRRLGDQYLVMVRNMSDRARNICIGNKEAQDVIFPHVELGARESCILPVGVQIPETDITIARSTSSLLFRHKVGKSVIFGLFGKTGRAGETVLNVEPSEVKVLAGMVRVGGEGSAVLSYTHEGMHVLGVKGHKLIILDQSLAAHVDPVQGGLIVSEIEFVREVTGKGRQLSLKAEARIGTRNRFWYLGEEQVDQVRIDGRPTKTQSECAGVQRFEYRAPSDESAAFAWLGDWHMNADTEEAAPAYRDMEWRIMDWPMSLEDAGLLKHGHVWYRMAVQIHEDARDVKLSMPGNATDRFYVFVNGHVVWSGIAQKMEQAIGDYVRPGRNVIAVLYENFYHTKSHPHEGVIQKYSGITGAVTVTGTLNDLPFKRRIYRFKVREQLGGSLMGYAEKDFDDSHWIIVPESRKYVMGEDLGSLVWMRRKFRYQCKDGRRVAVKLTIPDAKNRLILYINGRPLGQFESIGPQHDFYIPESFLQEENVLAMTWEGHRTFGDYTKGILIEPELGTFFDVKETVIEVRLAGGS